jgi:hypothetical protein
MGRIVDLCGEIAAAAEEGPEGLVLPREDWERLSDEWSEDEIEDALSLVRDSLLQSELVEAADSLSARLVEVLGAFGSADAFARAQKGEGTLSVETMDQLVRRVLRLEEILEVFRDGAPPDRRGLDALHRRLMDQGIEEEMRPEQGEPLVPDPEDED